MGACVSLQVKRIVESFTTESAQVPFNIRMTFHVSVKKALQGETLTANAAHELVAFFIGDTLDFNLFFFT